ncbi:DUF1129 family protein [Jeotgalibacillus sp. S-D1]|uniref:DUF1129 family protein n=1 Tax=Jeotgalibacillus sp. S-D1 TaxID=2552189 RepID=UPI00105A69BD|nr:DUF1129 family protein [Jeotgalibacillus sp. S-D1]TDL32048.1 DUF1129 family protein [Jeotgalibacillus sp. S-D1]
MTTTTAYIQQNNERRKKLNDQNESFYSDILLYVRSSNVDQRAGEELLLELLEHLIDAQERGRRAADVFGEDPEGYCKSLVDELPKETLTGKLLLWLYMAAYGAMWMFGLMGFMQLLFPELNKPVSLTHLLIFGSVFITIPLAAMVVMKKTVFMKDKPAKINIAWGITGAAILFLPYPIILFVPAGYEINLSWIIYLSITVILFIGTRLLKGRVFD